MTNDTKFDPVRDIMRGNCPCGKWLVVPRGFTEDRPLVCGGPCHSGKECGRLYFWRHGEFIDAGEE